jgi:DNA-binding IclR family transcriptional regulator
MAAYRTPSEHIRQLLATATEPLTTRHIAETVGVAPSSAARTLRRLEDQGAAVRQLAAGGCYAWTTTRK